MRIGASLFLIAVGAILKFAITRHFSGINVQTVGVVLMIIGIVGLAASLILLGTRRRTTVVQSAALPYADPRMMGTPVVDPRVMGTPVVDPRVPTRTTYVEPRDPIDLM